MTPGLRVTQVKDIKQLLKMLDLLLEVTSPPASPSRLLLTRTLQPFTKIVMKASS